MRTYFEVTSSKNARLKGTPRGSLFLCLAMAVATSMFTVGCGVSNNVSIPILPVPIGGTVFTITQTSPLGSTFQGQAFSLPISTAGGRAPLTTCRIGQVLSTGNISVLPAGTAVGVNPANPTQCLLTGVIPGAFAIPAGAPPPECSGQPCATVFFTIIAQDSSAPALSDTKTFELIIKIGFAFQSPVTLTNGTQGRAFTATLPTSFGNTTVAMASCSTAPPLPAGMTITVGGAGNRSCVIGGTPTVALAATLFTITATDNPAGAVPAPPPAVISGVSLTVNPTLTVPAFAPIGNGTVNRPFALNVLTAGGQGPITNCTAVGLPAGLAIAVLAPASCRITGTPTGVGAGNITVTATDTATASTLAGNASSPATPITVNPIISFNAIVYGNGTQGQPFSQTIPILGGQTPYTSCTATGLPTGVISAVSTTNCLVSGTPTVNGPFTVTLTAGDTATATTAAGNGSSAATPLAVNPTFAVPAFVLANGTEGVAFSFLTIATTGGELPLTACVSTGTLPAGLTVGFVGSNCTITGTPAAGSVGTYNVTVMASDTATTSTAVATASNAAPVSLTINGPLAIPAFTFGNGTQGSVFSQNVPITGGQQPYTACTAIGLPAGLVSGVSGTNCAITGTPTVSGPFTVTLTVTDTATATSAASNANSAATPLTVNAQLSVPAIVFGNATEGRIFDQTIATTGGNLPLTSCTASGLPGPVGNYAFSIVGGNQCRITGFIPAGSAGTPSIIVSVTDTASTSTGATTAPSAGTSLTINAVLTVPTIALANATEGSAYTFNVPTLNGEQPLTACVLGAGGVLPAGLTIGFAGGNCTITGTPAAATSGSSPFSVVFTATDSATTSTGVARSGINPPTEGVSAAMQLIVNGPLTIPVFTLPNATQGRSVGTLTIPTLGGNKPLTNCALVNAPAGLTAAPDPANTALNTNNCLITGTPTVNGTFNTLQLQATDTISGGSSTTATSANTTIIVRQTFALPAFVLANGTEGAPFSIVNIATTGGETPLTNCVLSGGTLPGGLTVGFSGNNCTITGTPAAGSAGNFLVTLTATDSPNSTVAPPNTIGSGTASNAVPVALHINPPLTIPAFTFPNATQGRSVGTLTIPTSGGNGNLTSCLAAGLPGGLTSGASGTNCTLTGTPGVNGPFTITFNATDTATATTAASSASSAPTPMTVNPTFQVPVFTFNEGVDSRTFSQSTATTGGEQPLTNCTATGLPAGLVAGFSGGNCTITGTPAAASAGTYNVTLTATDTASTVAVPPNTIPAGNAVSASTQLIINAPLTVNTVALANGTQNRVFGPVTIPTAGGLRPLATCTLLNAPAGLTAATDPANTAVNVNNCLISGTPTVNGTFATLQVQADDTSNPSTPSGTGTSANLPLTINAPLTLTTTSPLGAGTTNAPFSETFGVTGGQPPYTFSIIAGGQFTGNSGNAGTPCEGLTLNPGSGILSGTPTFAPGGVCSFTLQVADTATATTASGTTSQAYTVTINPALFITPGVVSPGTQPLGAGTVARLFSQTFSVIGGNPPYSAISAGGGSFTPAGGNIFNGNAATSCQGLVFDGNLGSMTGTPVNAGTCLFTLSVTDTATTTSGPTTDTQNYSSLINAALSITNTPPLGNGVQSRAFSESITVVGGNPPYAWSVTVGDFTGNVGNVGSACEGLSLNPATGAITGTPVNAGHCGTLGVGTFTVSVVDTLTTTTAAAAPGTVIQNTSTDIQTPLAIVAFVLGNGTQGAPFSQTITTTGGLPPIATCSAAATLAGTGLAIATGPGPSDCTISGTPTASGGFSVDVTVTDTPSASTAAGNGVSNGNLLTLNTPLGIAPAVAPPGFTGIAYTQGFISTGGESPFAWTAGPPFIANVGTGNCAGLTLGAGTGVLSGVPTAVAPTSCVFDLTVTDSATTSTAATSFTILGFTVAINQGLSIPAFVMNNATQGRAFSQNIPTTGGTQPLTSCILGVGGTLPTGLTVGFAGSNCTITGTPTSNGAFNVVLTATDSVNPAVTPNQQSFTNVGVAFLTNPTFTVNPVSFVGGNGTQGRAFGPVTVSTSGGNRPLTACNLLNGPAGLAAAPDPANTAVNVNNCIVSGTPTGSGSFGTLQVTATDTGNPSSVAGTANSGNMPLTVNAPLTITTTDPLADTAFNRAVSFTILNAGGQTGFTWSEVGANLNVGACNGLTLSAAGLLSGTANANNTTCTFTARVDDTATTTTASGNFQRTFNIFINPQLSVSTVNLAAFATTEGRAITTPIVIATAGGIRPLTACNLVNGPAGLTATPDPANTAVNVNNCRITGTPGAGSSAGSPFATLQVSGTDSTSATTALAQTASSGNMNLVVNAPFTFAAIAIGTGEETVPFSQSFATTGGQQPLTGCTLLAGALPGGLSVGFVGSNCTITGTPNAATAGAFSVTMQATDGTTSSTTGANLSSTPQLLTINAKLVITTASPLGDGVMARAFAQPGGFAATGGTGVAVANPWSITAGNFTAGVGNVGTPCEGLTLNSSTGAFTGTPANTGSCPFTLQFAEGNTTSTNGVAATKIFALTIHSTLALGSFSLSDGTVNTAYGPIDSMITGGIPPWVCSSPNLPTGLVVNFFTNAGIDRCRVTGTPTVGGSFANVQLRVDDTASTTTAAANTTANDSGTPFVIAFGPLSFTPAAGALNVGVRSRAYAFTFAPSGGNGVYTFSNPNGNLGAGNCAGLTISAAGGISGTPTVVNAAPVVCSFDVQLDDTQPSNTGPIGPYTITINPPITFTSATPIPNGLRDFAYNAVSGPNFSFVASGGLGGYTYSVTGSAQFTGNTGNAATPCQGLTLSAGGVLSGTMSANTGTCTFSVQAADTANASTSSGTGTQGPHALENLRRLVFVTETANNRVKVINQITDTEVTVAASIDTGAANSPDSVEVTPDGLHAIVTLSATNQFLVIDTRTLTVSTAATALTGCTTPGDIAIGQPGTNAAGKAYVACNGASNVGRIDMSNFTALAAVNTANNTNGVALTAAGDRLYIADGSNDLRHIPLNAGTGAEGAENITPNFFNTAPGTPATFRVRITNGRAYFGDTATNQIIPVDVPADNLTLGAAALGVVNTVQRLGVAENGGTHVYVTMSGSQFEVINDSGAPALDVAGAVSTGANTLSRGVTIPPVPSGTAKAYIALNAATTNAVRHHDDVTPFTANAANITLSSANGTPLGVGHIRIPK